MNANELADALKSMETGWFDDLTLKEAATMLRQQQAEIINKKLVNDTFADLIKLQGKKIDEQQAEIEALKSQRMRITEDGRIVPVFQILTDEEIEECFEESCTDFKLLENGKTKGVVNIIDVGRAILRKAQEK